MPEIKSIIAYIGPNQITEGFYTLNGDTLTMVHADGNAVRMADASAVTHIIKPSDNVEAIAKMLTKKIRTHFRGELVEGFSRNLEYPSQGVA